MKHAVAMIPYANMAPYREMGPPEGCCFVDCIPRESIRALREKRVWAAALPVGGLAELQGTTEFIGRYGIAVKREALSVLFFSSRPFGSFDRRNTISLTGESASSVRLLYLLMGYRLGFGALPSAVTKGSPADGCLVIGDRALRWAAEMESAGSVRGYRHVADLGSLWHAHTRLPFVFARWVVHREAPDGIKRTLGRWLDRFRAEERRCIRQAVPKVALRLNLTAAYTERYLTVIKRCLPEAYEAGQERFLADVRRFAPEPLFPAAIPVKRKLA
jgi:chorismate dehydratase